MPVIERLKVIELSLFESKVFIMAALHSRCGHYIFILWFLISIFLLFSSPNLSGQRFDVYRTSTHGVALVHILAR